MKKRKRIIGYGTLLICLLYLFFVNVKSNRLPEVQVFHYDIQIYYSYLPATFIEHDPFFERTSEYDSTSKYWTMPTPINRAVPKTTMGVAMLEMPFFLAAHTFASWTGKLANGFSKTYQLAIALSSLIYSLLGIYLLYRFLKRRFSEKASVLSVFFILFGTNLYFYSVYEVGMSHPYTFFLLAGLLVLVDNWLLKKSFWKSFGIGFLVGLIVLVRPINILFLLPIFLLFKDNTISWKAYLNQLFSPFYLIVLMVFGGIASWLPQLLFWKIQTGSYLYFSYEGESFFWNHPHVWEGLFSFRKGWFIYTPIAFISLLGMVFLYQTKRMMFIAISLFLSVFLYVTFSWWCWWYGGGFSARTLVDILPFVAIPLAALMEWVLQNKKRKLLLLIPVFFVYLNIFQSWQYYQHFLHYDSMTWPAYKSIFLKKYTPEEYWGLLDEPDYDRAREFGY